MKTKLLLLLLTLLTATLPATAYDFVVNNVRYTFTADGKAVEASGAIYVYSNSGYGGYTLNIPDEVTYVGVTYPVIAIAENFNAQSSSTSDGGISYFGRLNIGKNVKTIGKYAFKESFNLRTINIGENVTEIGEGAFYRCGYSNCHLESINIPSSVKIIGKTAFASCTYLRNITLSDNIESMDIDAFYNTAWINNLTDGVIYLGNYVLGYSGSMPNNYSVDINEGVVGIFTDDFATSKLVSINLPSTLKRIGDRTFTGSGLTSITIPDGLTSIGVAAFANCVNLSTTTIPNSVKNIGQNSFAGCVSLSSITIPNSVELLGGYSFYNCTGLTDVTLSNSITEISEYLFRDCTALKSITIPDAVTTINKGAFSNSGLTSISISNTVTALGDEIFKDCSDLKSANIPTSITNIGVNSFNNCTSLSNITIPGSVKTISAGAFSGCTGLTKLSLSNSLEYIESTAFSNCTNIKTLTFNASKLTNFSALNALTGVEMLNFGNNITAIPSTLTSSFTNLKNISLGTNIAAIDDNAFKGLRNLETIDLKSVKTIGNYAFDGCTGLTALTFPETVTSIGNYAMNGCTGLTTLTFSNTVTSIGDFALYGCTSLESVTLPTEMSVVSRGLFQGCTGLSSIALPGTVTMIKPSAFASTGLTSITLPAAMKVVSDSAFMDCAQLKTATLPSGLTTIGVRTFRNTALTSVNIPSSVTSIGAGAYQNCAALTTAKMPNSVKTVSEFLFDGCTALNSVTLGNAVTEVQQFAFYGTPLNIITLPNTLTKIGDSAFRQCDGLTSVSIPNNVTTIGKVAFGYCTGLTSVTIPAKLATLGINAFLGCSNVTTLNYRATALDEPGNLSGMANVEVVNFDGGATVVPANLLPNFSKLVTVNVGKDVTTIQNGAFTNCNVLKTLNYDAANCISGELSIASLDTLTIGANVKSLADWTFCYCTNLKKIVSKATTPPTLGNGVFPVNTYIGVPASSGATYKEKWSKIAAVPYTRVLPLPIYRFDIQANFMENGNPYVITYAWSESLASCSETGFIIIDNSNNNKKKVRSNNTVYNNSDMVFDNIELNKYVLPGHSYTIHPYIVVNGVEYDGYYSANLEMPALQAAYSSTVGPSSIILIDNTVIPENINFTSATFTLENRTYESYGNDIIVTGLKPYKWYSGNYNVTVSEGTVNSTNVQFNTPSLTMNTQPVRMLTNTVAMFQAFTNLSEEETSCGFLWKRYDAPDEMLGNPVYCPVYDGMMMGTLKNMPEGVYYKYRPFYRDNEGYQYYGDWVAFFTGDATVEFEPVAHTYDNARVNGSNAIIQGIAIRGSKEITEQGFEYWTNGSAQSETLMAPKAVNKVTATGERMSSTLANLNSGTNYLFRAYVKTADGTTYGEIRSFSTHKIGIVGDVDGNGIIDVEDVNAAINIILKLNSISDYSGSCDMDGNGIIDVEDVNAMINIILKL